MWMPPQAGRVQVRHTVGRRTTQVTTHTDERDPAQAERVGRRRPWQRLVAVIVGLQCLGDGVQDRLVFRVAPEPCHQVVGVLVSHQPVDLLASAAASAPGWTPLTSTSLSRDPRPATIRTSRAGTPATAAT
jgi:hypothetical protein